MSDPNDAQNSLGRWPRERQKRKKTDRYTRNGQGVDQIDMLVFNISIPVVALLTVLSFSLFCSHPSSFIRICIRFMLRVSELASRIHLLTVGQVAETFLIFCLELTASVRILFFFYVRRIPWPCMPLAESNSMLNEGKIEAPVAFQMIFSLS